MKFLHLSDTHIRLNYQTNNLTSPMFNDTRNPVLQFKELLTKVKQEQYDFALITGDLVHEGEKEDYELFKQLWQDTLPEVPYYFCRGNHDRRSVFFDAMAVIGNEANEYIACDTFKGLRIIRIDSAQDEYHEGRISLAQMHQLAEWLNEPSEKGTLLLQHHPLTWEKEGIATHVPEGFDEIIRHSDIKGIFVGHIHQGTTAPYAGKIQYMAEALSFGVDEYPDESIFTDRNGYNSCSLTDDGIFVYHHYLAPSQTQIGQLKKPFEGNF